MSAVAGGVSVPASAPGSVATIGVPAVTVPGVKALPLPAAPTVTLPVPSTPGVSVPVPSPPSVSVPVPSTPTVAVPVPSTPPVVTPPVVGGTTDSGRVSPGAVAAGAGTPASAGAPVADRTAARAPGSGSGGAAPGGGSPPASAGATPSPTPPGLSPAPATTAVPGSPAAHRASKSSASDGNPLDALGRNLPLPLPVPDWSKPIILALLVLAVWFWVRSRLAARRARGLERQRVVMQRDLEVMQAAVVPDLPEEVGGLRISAAYRAAEGPAAGGDFYDVFVPAPGKVAVILGDVVGHGHEALNDAALTRYTLRAYLQAGLEPRAALSLAGQVLTDAARERYVTVVIGLFDPLAGQLTYATAGHPTPLILGSYEPSAICTCPAISCGLPTGRRQTSVSLAPGAEVCFFTDGLIEARVGEGLFGRERLREILPGLGSRPLAKDLLAAIRDEAESCPDDMAACIVIPEMAAAAASDHVEEFEVDAEALAGDQPQTFLAACEVPHAEVGHALRTASEIAGAEGGAVLRVVMRPAGSTVTVSRPPLATVPSHIAAVGAMPPALDGYGEGLPLGSVG